MAFCSVLNANTETVPVTDDELLFGNIAESVNASNHFYRYVDHLLSTC